MLNRIKKDYLEIVLRLLFDGLFIVLVLFFLTLLSEAILPGIITSRLGWRYLVLALIFDLGLIYFIAKIFNFSLTFLKFEITKKRILIWGFLIFLVFLGGFWRGSLVSFIMAILAACIVLGFLKIPEN